MKDFTNEKSTDLKKTTILPWPSRGETPISEYTTDHFFTSAFPSLFLYSSGDFFDSRPVTCLSMSEWADHLLRFEDDRFAKDSDFKFIVQNMMRKMALESSTFVFNQKLGNKHLIVEDLKKKLQNWDTAVSKKILFFSASLCRTSQKWAQRANTAL